MQKENRYMRYCGLFLFSLSFLSCASLLDPNEFSYGSPKNPLALELSSVYVPHQTQLVLQVDHVPANTPKYATQAVTVSIQPNGDWKEVTFLGTGLSGADGYLQKGTLIEFRQVLYQDSELDFVTYEAGGSLMTMFCFKLGKDWQVKMNKDEVIQIVDKILKLNSSY